MAESGAYRIKRRFAGDGLDGALRDRPQAHRYCKPDDRAGAHISPPWPAPRLPKGMTTGRCGAWRAGRWSWDWLRLCTMRACAAISKSAGKPWRSKRWRIPGVSAGFVAHGEDVPDLYAEPCGPQRPVVCFDETPARMLAGVRPPMPAKPGRVRREDCECRREDARNLSLSCEPIAGRRHVEVTERRTKTDFARQMRRPVEDACPEAGVIRVVLDNLNTHRKATLYEAFPAEEARRIGRKPEFHHTPKHGSWLNMAEIEFSVIARLCLGQRHPDGDSLCRDVRAWSRNAIRLRRSSPAFHYPGCQNETPSPLSPIPRVTEY